MASILFVDDHVLFLESVESLLSNLLPDIPIVYSPTLDDMHHQLSAHESIELLILDFNIPGSEGLDTVEKLQTNYPKIKLAIISGRLTRTEVAECVSLGVCGVLLKEATSSELVNAIETMLNGGFYLPSSLLSPTTYSKTITRTGKPLTPREHEVLELIHNGFSNKSIARALKISEVTVKMHLTNLFKKYEVSNRTELAVKGADDVSFTA